jgi:hypothetical protein
MQVKVRPALNELKEPNHSGQIRVRLQRGKGWHFLQADPQIGPEGVKARGLIVRECCLWVIGAPGCFCGVNPSQIQDHFLAQLSFTRTAQTPQSKPHDQQQQRHHCHYLNQ